MARNSEKRLSGLNRFLEAKDAEKSAKLQRPPLSRLSTADDVKGWIPSIENEIRYLLRQIEGTGSRKHNDTKIQEFQDRIDHLKREHKRFVAKVRSLDPSYSDVVPWQPRGYRRKRGRGDGELTTTDGEMSARPQVKKLYSPLLAQEEQVQPASQKPEYTTQSRECNYPLSKVDMKNYVHKDTTEQTRDIVVLSSGASRNGLLGLDYSSSDDET